jgi:polyhydroxybutyrate depolymerase
MFMKILATVAFLVLLAPLSARADDLQSNLKVGGEDRTYLVHLPKGPQTAEPKPLVIAFHGAGMTSKLMADTTELNQWSDKTGFIVAYPQGINRRWRVGTKTSEDYVFVTALIAALEGSYTVDRSRVIAAGFSNGAEFAQELGCRKEFRFKAVVAVSATLQEDSVKHCAPSHPVRIITFHGADDPIVPYLGGRVLVSNGPIVISVADDLLAWARLNRCSTVPHSVRLPDRVEDGTHVDRISFANCRPESEVTHYHIIGGGHTWAGGPAEPERLGRITHQLSASQVIAETVASTAAK